MRYDVVSEPLERTVGLQETSIRVTEMPASSIRFGRSAAF
jgi:hypothetical protein